MGRGWGGLHIFENFEELLRKSVFNPHFELLVSTPPPPPLLTLTKLTPQETFSNKLL